MISAVPALLRVLAISLSVGAICLILVRVGTAVRMRRSINRLTRQDETWERGL